MAEVKAKKLTAAQVRAKLKGYKKEELAALLEGMYRCCPDAANYVNIRLSGDAFERSLLFEARSRVRDGFFTKRGKARLNLPAAKAAIDDFRKADPQPGSLLDLKLHYIEDGMEIIEAYNHIPDSLYSAVERMFQSVVRDLNAVEDPAAGKALADRFRARLESAGRDYGLGEAGFHKSMHASYREIRWLQAENEPATGQAASGTAKSAAPGTDESASPIPAYPEPAPLTDSADVLPEEDVALFYRLFFSLLNFANEKRHVSDLKDLSQQKSLDPNAVKKIADAVWSDTSLIDEFLETEGSALAPEHKGILYGWKRRLTGRFIYERNLKKGAVLISMEDNSVYLVRGIQTSLDEMFYYRSLPIMISATLLPFRGILITDGLIGGMNIYLGSGIKKEYREVYTTAKRRGLVSTSL